MTTRTPELETLPALFLQRVERLVPPDRHADLAVSFASERDTAFRVNTLRGDITSTLLMLEREGLTVEAIAWLPGAYRVPHSQRRTLTESSAFKGGEIYIQNAASMLPALFLAPRPNDRVLDLAAAPGSKTLQMAAMMGNAGWISAVESVRERFFRLRANLEKHGATNVHTYHRDGTRVWRQVPEQFDKVLLDAPCSSEGQFSLLRPVTFQYWSQKKIGEMSRKQKRLLYSAIQCLKPGGTLVYSTCTFAPEENEAVIDAMLRRFQGKLRVKPLRLEAPTALPGCAEWYGKRYDTNLAGALRILPDHLAEGFFICKLHKIQSTMEQALER